VELLVHVESGEIKSVVTCDIEGATIAPVCHDELVFHRAHITLSFSKALLEDWREMEIRSQRLLISFSQDVQ
jgi:hypothetical protein